MERSASSLYANTRLNSRHTLAQPGSTKKHPSLVDSETTPSNCVSTQNSKTGIPRGLVTYHTQTTCSREANSLSRDPSTQLKHLASYLTETRYYILSLCTSPDRGRWTLSTLLEQTHDCSPPCGIPSERLDARTNRVSNHRPRYESTNQNEIER